MLDISNSIRSVTARLREWVGDRRLSPRLKAQRKVRLLFSISLLDEAKTDQSRARLLPLEGHTRDISRTGLALVVPTIRIGDRYLTDEQCTLRIVLLDLPTGQVELKAVPVRYRQLDETEGVIGHLIGVRITEMSKGDRERFNEYLHLLR